MGDASLLNGGSVWASLFDGVLGDPAKVTEESELPQTGMPASLEQELSSIFVEPCLLQVPPAACPTPPHGMLWHDMQHICLVLHLPGRRLAESDMCACKAALLSCGMGRQGTMLRHGCRVRNMGQGARRCSWSGGMALQSCVRGQNVVAYGRKYSIHSQYQ